MRQVADGLWGALCVGRRVVPTCILALVLALPALPAVGQAGPPPMPGDAQQPSDGTDPPARVGRLSYISGTVSFHTVDEDQWEPAAVNYPVTEGLSFWTEPGARASLQLGHGVVRLDGSTEVDVQQFNDQVIQINVPQGSINFRLRRLDPDETYQIATPSGTVALTSAGSFHVDAGANGAPGGVTVLQGQAQLVGDNSGMTINNGQQQAPPQDIDAWSDQQEAQVAQVPNYVSPDMPGVDDLGGQGNWDRAPDYGAVWYPPVQAGWAPYRYGHWGFVPPWGWTWIDDAPWGFAPFHYGRWAEIRGRWGWIPGEVVERPVYAPALVAFVGGSGLAVSIGVGPVVGWVPLGPREVYVPPYGGSISYIRRVNVTNVTNVNSITINNINTFRGDGNAGRFANASAATVVRPEAMSGSSRIANAAVKLPPNALNTATVSNQPAVKPTSATVGAGPTVVKALGGNVANDQRHARAPGPKVEAKPLPATLIKPLTNTNPTPGGSAPGPKFTPATGAGTGTGAAGTGTGNKGTGSTGTPGPNNRFAPAAGAGTGTNTNTNAGAGTGTGTGTGAKGTGSTGAGPTNKFTPAAGAGAGTNPNPNPNPNTGTGAATGNKGTGAPGPNNRFAPTTGPGTGTNTNANTNTNTGAGTGNKGTGAPGPNNRFTPTTGPGTGTNTNTNTNATGNKATGAAGPNTPTTGPGTGTNTNTNANTNSGNKATGAKTFTPAAGAGSGQPAGGGQTNVNKGQTNAPKPPPPPPPKQGGDKNAKCDPKVQKCPPP